MSASISQFPEDEGQDCVEGEVYDEPAYCPTCGKLVTATIRRNQFKVLVPVCDFCGEETDIPDDEPLTVLDRPLTNAQILEQVDDDGWITGVVRVALSDITDTDLEGLLDLLSGALCNNGLLSDISYTVVGFEPDNVLLMKVTGDTSLMELDPEPDVNGGADSTDCLDGCNYGCAYCEEHNCAYCATVKPVDGEDEDEE